MNSEEAINDVMESLGFCGCGMPEDAIAFVRDGLRLLRDLQEKVLEKTESFKSWSARVEAHFGSEGGAYFFWYWLDKEGLSEHGGSVPGWLSPKGAELLDRIEINFKE